MFNNNNYIYALTIKERVEAFKQNNIDLLTDKTFIERWLSIRGLSNINDTIEKLQFDDITLDEFVYAIKPFNLYEEDILNRKLIESKWFIDYKNIIREYIELDIAVKEEIDKSNNSTAYIIRPFLNNFIKCIKRKSDELDNIVLSGEAVSGIVDYVANLLSFYVIKIITLSVNQYAAEDNSNSDFAKFLADKYGDIKKLLKLYEEYPTMIRLITIKLDNLKNHFCKLLSRIDNDYYEIKDLIKTSSNRISNIKCSEGDSHQQGQTVLTVIFEDCQKVVYKPKNLIVQEKFNNLIEWINTFDNTKLEKFSTVESIYKEDYTYCEFIENKDCENNIDVEKYYKRIGQYMMLFYTLNGNDFHFENIIASGGIPYVVDLETLFQNTGNIYMTFNTVEEKIMNKSKSTILNMGILPLIGLNQNEEGKGVDISALNGRKQKTPFKVLQLENANTLNMIFKYKYSEIGDAQNIPILNQDRVFFDDYVVAIIEGFSEMGNFIINNRELFISNLDRFRGVKVRQLTKSTANYGVLLQFVNHPNYLNDMIYFERLLDNSMAYPYLNKKIIKHELKDMYMGDIPIFYEYIDSRDLISSTGDKEVDYFKSKPIDISLDILNKLNVESINEQIKYIILTLNEFEKINSREIEAINECVFEVSNINDFSEYIINIDNSISDLIIKNDDYSDISWEVIDSKTGNISAMSLDLFNGIAGMGLYYELMNKVSHSDEYKKNSHIILEKLIQIPNSLIKKNNDLISIYNYFSKLYKMDKQIKIFDKLESSFYILEEAVSNIKSTDENNIKEINKILALIQTLDNIYNSIEDNKFKKMKEDLELVLSSKLDRVEDLDIDAIVLINKYIATLPEIKEQSDRILLNYIDSIMQEYTFDSWKESKLDTYSNGVLFKVNLLIDKYEETDNILYLNKAKEFLEITISSYKVNNRYRITSGLGFDKLTLREGLTGLALSMLRIQNIHTIPNVFLL